MRKYIALVFALVCVLCLVGCNSNQQGNEEKTKTHTLDIMENTVAEIGKGTLKTAVELSEEDADTLTKIIEGGSWNTNGTTDCFSDCAINLKGKFVYYHSDCGTFNEYDISDMSYLSSQEQEVDGKNLALSEAEQMTVNTILQKYITLGTDTKPTE